MDASSTDGPEVMAHKSGTLIVHRDGYEQLSFLQGSVVRCD